MRRRCPQHFGFRRSLHLGCNKADQRSFLGGIHLTSKSGRFGWEYCESGIPSAALFLSRSFSLPTTLPALMVRTPAVIPLSISFIPSPIVAGKTEGRCRHSFTGWKTLANTRETNHLSSRRLCPLSTQSSHCLSTSTNEKGRPVAEPPLPLSPRTAAYCAPGATSPR